MGLRLRKSFKILPGIRVNLSKSGRSVSVGRPGATVNLSKRGTRTTVGVPGAGISYSKVIKAVKVTQTREPESSLVIAVIFLFLLFALVCIFAALSR